MFGFWQRRRFRDVIRRQLMIFETAHGDLVREARAELRAYHASHDPAEAQSRYARYDDLCEDAEDTLCEMRDNLSATMPVDRSRHYVSAFDRRVRATYGDIVARLGFDDMFEGDRSDSATTQE